MEGYHVREHSQVFWGGGRVGGREGRGCNIVHSFHEFPHQRTPAMAPRLSIFLQLLLHYIRCWMYGSIVGEQEKGVEGQSAVPCMVGELSLLKKLCRYLEMKAVSPAKARARDEN